MRNRLASAHRHAQNATMNEDASYVCDSCGEEIVVPIDLSAGSSQEYVEDCPVCCCPNVIRIDVDEEGDVRVWAARE
jgi:hypothetical protein